MKVEDGLLAAFNQGLALAPRGKRDGLSVGQRSRSEMYLELSIKAHRSSRSGTCTRHIFHLGQTKELGKGIYTLHEGTGGYQSRQCGVDVAAANKVTRVGTSATHIGLADLAQFRHCRKGLDNTMGDSRVQRQSW